MRMIETNGVTLAVQDLGEGDAVVLLHGFPELSYSWRHQVQPLADAGFRVIVPDQRGYGASSKPDGVDAYGLETLAADVVGVLDRLGIASATIVGHDWGSIVTYTTAILHPDRVDRVVSLNVPYQGHCEGFPTTEFMAERLKDRFGYVLMFQEDGRAEEGFARHPEMWLQAFYMGGSRGRSFMTDEELAVYVDAFTDGGITGPVNWYRNIDANSARFATHKNAEIAQPTLLIAPDSDPVLPLSVTESMSRWVPRLDRTIIEDCGHWTQQERPDEVTDALIGWLGA
jgi:pimeloyl-ACP methyl ester carboxylesterase